MQELFCEGEVLCYERVIAHCKGQDFEQAMLALCEQADKDANLVNLQNILQEYAEGMAIKLEDSIYGRFKEQMRRMVDLYNRARGAASQAQELMLGDRWTAFARYQKRIG